PLRGFSLLIAAIEQIPADVDVQQEIAVQHEDVPTEHRFWEVHLPDSGNQMPEPIRPSEVNGHEEEAHNDRGDREQLAEDHEIVQFLIIINVNGDDHHHGRSGDADEEGEVRDVNAPRNFVAHSGDDEAVNELLGVSIEPEEANGGKEPHPGVITPVA